MTNAFSFSSHCVQCSGPVQTNLIVSRFKDIFLEMTQSELSESEGLCFSCLEGLWGGLPESGFHLAQYRPYRELGIGPSEAVKWLENGIGPEEASCWEEVLSEKFFFDFFEKASDWISAGFSPDYVIEWMEWGLKPDKLAALLEECEFDFEDSPPSINYKQFGFELDDAISLASSGFSVDELDGSESEDSLEFWVSSGLTVSELVFLKDEFDERIEDFKEMHLVYTERGTDWTPELGPTIKSTFTALKSLGMRMTIENLLDYWGLTTSQILEAVDMGVTNDFAKDVNLAGKLVRLGIPENKVKDFWQLVSAGIEQDSAIELALIGISVESLKEVMRNGFSADDVISIAQSLKSKKSDEVATWLLVDIGVAKADWLSHVVEWCKLGFAPEVAAEWFTKGFKANDAHAWVKSGAKTPAIAERRKAAGVSPKTVS